MNIEPNKPELKLAMAKLLPEKIRHFVWHTHTNDDDITIISIDKFSWKDSKRDILETEWLFVMQMVEKKLPAKDRAKYCYLLAVECGAQTNANAEYLIYDLCCFDATFNRRATAISKMEVLTPSPSERSC